MNNPKEHIEEILTGFKPISLSEMDDVSFLKRTDTKYLFHRERLIPFLQELKEKCRMLEITGKRIQAYETHYFDTLEHTMFGSHHKGLRNRYKIRARQYVNSGDAFLEIKKKNNKNITSKKRIPVDGLLANEWDKHQAMFISERSPYHLDDLHLAVNNRFNRITLVDEQTPARITIDFDIQFIDPESGELHKLENTCIAELKTERGTSNRWFAKIARDNGIQKRGFSKYCFGLLGFNHNLKTNRFKPRVRELQKMNLI